MARLIPIMLNEKRYSVIRITEQFAPNRYGGAVNHIIELSEKINPYLGNQLIIAPSGKDSSKFDASFSIPVYRVKKPQLRLGVSLSLLNNIIFSRRVVKIIKKNPFGDFDIIHAHGILLGLFVNIFLKLYRVDKPLVLMVHGRYPHRVRWLSLSYYLEKPLIRTFPPHHVLILNDGTEIGEIVNVLRDRDIPYDIVLHGIDTTFFCSDPPEVNDDTFIILFPHRPISVKRPDLAIEAFEQFVLKNPGRKSKLIFFGLDPSDGFFNLIKNTEVSNRIQLEPVQNKDGMKKFYNSCSVVIGTSIESNMGRAILEAMSCEKTVIVFKNEEICNLITNCKNGLLIQPGVTKYFSEALDYCAQNPNFLKKIGKEARDTIIKSRSWDKRIAQELAAYHSALKR